MSVVSPSLLHSCDSTTVLWSNSVVCFFPSCNLPEEVPDSLRLLVRLVARAFYRDEHIVVLDVLSKYPW